MTKNSTDRKKSIQSQEPPSSYQKQQKMAKIVAVVLAGALVLSIVGPFLGQLAG